MKSVSMLAAALIVSTFVTGCAGTVARATPESQRVTSGVYDGIWEVDVLKAPGRQTVGQWSLACGDMRHKFNIQVADGAVLLDNGKAVEKAYVSESGQFKAYLPLEQKASASGNSSGSMGNGDMQIILRGKLGSEDSVGYLTYGIAEVGYGGCTAKTRFKYLGKAAEQIGA